MCSQSLSEVIKIIDFTDTETRYCGDYHYTVSFNSLSIMDIY